MGVLTVLCIWYLAVRYYGNRTALYTALILLSVGLLIPWATVRTRRYKLENLSMDVQGDLAAIAAVQSEEVSALGDEIGEVFDYDFGL